MSNQQSTVFGKPGGRRIAADSFWQARRRPVLTVVKKVNHEVREGHEENIKVISVISEYGRSGQNGRCGRIQTNTDYTD